ncbi:hypothetical protein GGR57DRAFT_507102 [Xylariaceae sp. FL1272]|nr:hypothetical protein GGR57DRAFT_507102 [Xylariaceae sp. FL1272]
MGIEVSPVACFKPSQALMYFAAMRTSLSVRPPPQLRLQHFQTPPPNQKLHLKKGDATIEKVDFSRKEGDYIDQTAMLGVNAQRLYDAYAKRENDALLTIEQTLEIEKQMLLLRNNAI